MSYKDGMAALNLERPSRVPRTQYSVEMHSEVLERVTGMKMSESWERVVQKFYEKWNFDFFWNVLIVGSEFD